MSPLENNLHYMIAFEIPIAYDPEILLVSAFNKLLQYSCLLLFVGAAQISISSTIDKIQFTHALYIAVNMSELQLHA